VFILKEKDGGRIRNEVLRTRDDKTMAFIQQIIFTLTLFLTHIMFGQITCDTLSPDLIKQLDGYSPKKLRKLIQNKKTDLNTICNIATYLRNKGDTTYKQWCAVFIYRLKKYWNGDHDKDKGHRASMLFISGKVYYYLGDYTTARTFLSKALAAKCTDPCISYFLSEAEKN
jgi:hypothetical protein